MAIQGIILKPNEPLVNSGVIFLENKLLLQPDVVFDFESNGRNLSSPAPPGSEKKNLFHLSQKMRKNAHAY